LAAIEALLGKILRHGGFELKFAVHRAADRSASPEAPEVVVEFSGADAGLLLGSGGAALDALEYLVLRAVRLDENLFGKIVFDCEDFRRLRAEELRMMAEVAAARVGETHEPFAFNPMPPRERRIIHLALKENTTVRTSSDGTGHERRVVIHPALATPRR
jgi:spoIIIJ-associated protein